MAKQETPTVYSSREYWQHVGERMQARTSGQEFAGDDSPFYRRKRELVTDRLLTADLIAGRDVLEIGCGPGGNLVHMQRLGARRVAGIDAAPSMIELARERTTPPIELTVSSGGGLPFPDQSFDTVVTVTVLQHNPDADAAGIIGEACRVSRDMVLIAEDTAVVRLRDRPSHFLRTAGGYDSMFRPHGFRRIGTRRLGLVASEVGAVALRALLARGRPEGEPLSPRQRRIESTALSITRALDPITPRVVGITRLLYQR